MLPLGASCAASPTCHPLVQSIKHQPSTTAKWQQPVRLEQCQQARHQPACPFLLSCAGVRGVCTASQGQQLPTATYQPGSPQLSACSFQVRRANPCVPDLAPLAPKVKHYLAERMYTYKVHQEIFRRQAQLVLRHTLPQYTSHMHVDVMLLTSALIDDRSGNLRLL